LSRTHTSSWRWQREGLLSAVSAGMFLLLIGVIILATPGLVDKIVTYFQDFTLVSTRFIGVDFSLPAPEHPVSHLAVYQATLQFCIAWGAFEVVLLALRYWFRSSVDRKGRNISNIVFWFGTAYIIQTMLNTPALTHDRWFQFWAILVVVLGVSLVARALYLAVMWPLSRHLYAATSPV
jgi:hypothetical protein